MDAAGGRGQGAGQCCQTSSRTGGRQKRRKQEEVSRQTRALTEANRSLAVAASTDYLTNLLNRRGFLAEVESEEAADKHFYAVIDVDNFKSFNDRHGHDTGDVVLQHVAAVLDEVTRDTDLVARWGGEEFIIRFQSTSEQDALDAAGIAGDLVPIRMRIAIKQAGTSP